MARQRRRPKPWAEEKRGLTRYCWRFENERYRTPYYENPDDAYADAAQQITEQMQGTWQDRSGPKMLLEEWINVWRELLDVEPTTVAKYKYLIQAHILPEFEGRGTRRPVLRGDREMGEGYPDPDQRPRHALRAIGCPRRPRPADHHPRRRRPRQEDRLQPRRTTQGTQRTSPGQGQARRPRTPSSPTTGQRDHPRPGDLLRRTLRPALRPGHRLRHEHLRHLDRRPLGRAHGRRRLGRQRLTDPAPSHRHRHLPARLAAPRTRRRRHQSTPERRLLPHPGPAALPRRPDALGDR